MAGKRRVDVPRLMFLLSALLLFTGIIFLAGMIAGVQRNAAYQAVGGVLADLQAVRMELASRGPGPVHFLQPARVEGNGVTVNARPEDGALILMAGFFDGGNELRLIRRDGGIVARWPARFSEHFPEAAHLSAPPAHDLAVDTHGAMIRPDGSVVFNYEYAGTVKLSRCGEVLWTLPFMTHHSVEPASAGGYWIPGRRLVSDPDAFPPFTRADERPMAEDLILHVGEDGEIVGRASIPRILYENGLEPLMTATGFPFHRGGDWNQELVHSNKIAELSAERAAAFPEFEAGDLLISLRQYNLIMVVDPDDWRIKWRRTGPWVRQHDPEFGPDGRIWVFDNNRYWSALAPPYDRADPETPRDSRILRASPGDGRVEVAYGGREGQEFGTTIRGKLDLTPDGGLLITEFEAGRVFEVDAEGDLIWEYVNRYDEDEVLEISEARLYRPDYFEVSDWSCPPAD